MIEREIPDSVLATARAEKDGLLRHFGFRASPFGVTPDPDFLFWTQMHSKALQAMVSSIESDLGFSVLLGAPGTGKTSLLFHLLALYRDSAHTAFIFQTQCRPHDLIRHIASEFDLAVPHDDEVSLHQKLNAMLIEQARAGRKVLVVIDEAQDLQASAFEAVRLLSDFETGHSKLLHIVFSGSPQLGEILSSAELSQLTQRISAIARLEPLGESEVADYVRFRLACVGSERRDGLFLPEALAEVYTCSHGIPRIINGICYRALMLAYSHGELSIGSELVSKAARDFELSSSCVKKSLATPVDWQLDTASHTNNIAVSASANSKRSVEPPAPAHATTATWPRLPARRVPAASPTSSLLRNQKSARRGHPVPAKADRRRTAGMNGITAFKTAARHHYLSTGLIAGIVLIATALWIAGNQLRARHGALDAQTAQSQPQESPSPQAQSPAPESGLNADTGVPPDPAQQPARSAEAVPSTSTRLAPPDQASASTDIGANLFMASKIPPQPATRSEPSSPNTAVALPTQSGDLAQLTAIGRAASPQLEKSEAALPSGTRTSFSLHPIKVVQPEYPARARLSHMEGEVQVELSIDRNGIVRSARALSGNAILAQAAEDAAIQWRYAPYTGDDPVAFPKVTRVLFNFRFNSGAATKQ